MKKNIQYLILLLLLFVNISLLKGQYLSTLYQTEKTIIITDRQLYVTNEKILFSVLIINSNTAKSNVNSKVTYVELIDPRGNKINNGKYSIEDNHCYGSMNIPDETISGNYYLRAYTRIMRNNGPLDYAYQPIKIVNPNNSAILPTNDFKVDSIEVNSIQNSAHLIDSSIDLFLDKSEYSPRDTVKITVNKKIADKTVYTVSVVPENTIVTTDEKKLHTISNTTNNPYYLPESRGISISGNVFSDVTRGAASSIKVNLSIVGVEKDFMATITDSSGRFAFSLPDYVGNFDLLLCSNVSNGEPTTIRIDNDFCNEKVDLTTDKFTLTENEQVAILKLARNVQLEHQYYSDSIINKGFFEKYTMPFYGYPSKVLKLDNFVQLPKLEEYFIELLPEVQVVKHNGKFRFKVIGSQSELNLFDPLLLVDWVAINDPEKILAINPQKISRIEIINSPYIKGDMIYGGIISLISKQGDFAGIDLPTSGLFLNYKFYTTENIGKTNKIDKNMPDTRNTLLWIPSLNNTLKTGNNICFTTPDTPGEYALVVYAIKDSKKYIANKISFSVLNK